MSDPNTNSFAPTSEAVQDLDQDVLFNTQKEQFFGNLKERLAPAMRLHEANGLWAEDDDWSNVTDHCLLQAARVEVMASMAGLDNALTDDLMIAAALHDAYKKEEVLGLKKNDFSWDSYMNSQVAAEAQLVAWKFNPRTIELAKSVAHETVPDMWAIVQPYYGGAEIKPVDLAKLIMHYSDDYTSDAEWAKMDTDGEELISPLEQRMRRNEAGAKYQVINETGKRYFGGATTYTAQRSAGAEVERVLTSIVNENLGTDIADGYLPLVVDAEIISKIKNY